MPGAHLMTYWRIKPPFHPEEQWPVVKEIRITQQGWAENALKIEASRLAIMGKLQAVLRHGQTYYIVMDYLGDQWERGSVRDEADLMRQTDRQDEVNFGFKRKEPLANSDYTWTRHDNSWVLRSVGKWRMAELKGGIKKPVPKDNYYCGITGWDENDLPIILPLNTVHRAA